MHKITSTRWLEIGVPVSLFLAALWSGTADALGPMGNPDFLDRGGFYGVDRLTSDPDFALGQEIYLGRSKTFRGLKVCVAIKSADEDPDAPKAAPVSRKLMRSFKGQNVTALTTRLVDCSEPEKRLALLLDRREFRALVYYINKRFRLLLKEP